MKVGLLGGRTNSWRAAEKLNGNYDLVGFQCIKQVFAALKKAKVKRIIVPVENSVTGKIEKHTWMIEEYKLREVDRLSIPVEHCIARGRRRVALGFIMSHEEALKQCGQYIDVWYPEVYRERMPSTDAAAEFVARIGIGGVIANFEACNHYGLEVIERDIVKNNYSVFALLEKGNV